MNVLKLLLSRLSSSSRAPLARSLGAVLPFVLLVALISLFDQRLGSIPPLGVFLDPFHGAWLAPDDDLHSWGETLNIPGLKAPVVVRIDEDRIKHVFAQNDEDLWLAQGYLVASDRLWQMEFIARVASGRLAELVGPRAVDADKMFIKLGLPEAAAESLEYMQHHELTRTALAAYARGVNAYIAGLEPHQLPFEYKLLDSRPETWAPLKTALLLKFMAYMLSFSNHDLSLSRSFARLGETDFNALFPLDLPLANPIVPNDKTWSFHSRAPQAPPRPYSVDLERILPYPAPHPNNGSNNWALMGKKSTSGRPIVSNDVHLDYALPSLWYQIQLHSPRQNVYGGTIPGAPGVILGFNANVAWAVTNGGTDIVDWFDLRFRDQQRHEYLHDGQWRPVVATDRSIKVRGREAVRITLRKTHFGPIVYDESEVPLSPMAARGLAMRWAALDPSNELKTFLLLNRARNFSECRAAITAFNHPAQNFICADQGGDVGIFHEGSFPLRWKGQGRMVSDGTDPVYAWREWISREELPFIINPSRGFVSSANQAPASSEYPHYLGWPFEQTFRIDRINELLASKAKFSPEEMVAMQSDTLSLEAKAVVPLLLRLLPTEGLGAPAQAAVKNLRAWDFRVEPDSSAAVLFSDWWERLQKAIWADDFPVANHYFVPRASRTIEMILHAPDAKWFDRLETEKKETLTDLVSDTFHASLDALIERFGEAPQAWRWSLYQPAVFPHFARIPGLGTDIVPTRGHGSTIFSNRGDHGPVWKMVVALGAKPRAWVLYPGGQSGQPGSRFYDNFVADWAAGRMREVTFLSASSEPMAREFKRIRMEAER